MKLRSRKEVEARKWTGTKKSTKEILDWINDYRDSYNWQNVSTDALWNFGMVGRKSL